MRFHSPWFSSMFCSLPPRLNDIDYSFTQGTNQIISFQLNIHHRNIINPENWECLLRPILIECGRNPFGLHMWCLPKSLVVQVVHLIS